MVGTNRSDSRALSFVLSFGAFGGLDDMVVVEVEVEDFLLDGYKSKISFSGPLVSSVCDS